ncbi:MAG TPA: hypothetical protein VNZ52_12685, partial [Candidatus Thermoplasmatota archaeon]|nr:hypothetical protein [Candidatus Thermoplasmatota archaeon]
LWNQAFDLGLTMQRETLEASREAAKAGLAVQRANLRGLRASMDRLTSTNLLESTGRQAADTLSRTTGDARTGETVRRATEDTLRATATVPVETARQTVTLTLDPLDRLLTAWETQVESATTAAVAATRSLTEANRAFTLSAVEGWMALAQAGEAATRTTLGTARATTGSKERTG